MRRKGSEKGWFNLPPEHFAEVADNFVSADTLTAVQRKQRISHDAGDSIVLRTASNRQPTRDQTMLLPSRMSKHVKISLYRAAAATKTSAMILSSPPSANSQTSLMLDAKATRGFITNE